jgi:hypothetical protein
MALISSEEVAQATLERESLTRELAATESRVVLVLVGTSAIIYVSLALLFEPLFRFSNASLRVAMLFAPTANALAWTLWGANGWFTHLRLTRRGREFGSRSELEVFDEVEYARYRTQRQTRISAMIMLLVAFSMFSLAYGLVAASLQARL